MGYPIQAGAPKITISGRTFTVGAFVWSNPVGVFYRVGVFEDKPESGTTSWNDVGSVALYTSAGDCLKDVQAKGGMVKYMQWLIGRINAIFAQIFAVPPAPPVGEPITDDQAKAAITAAINGLRLTLVNGVPVLS